VALSHKLLRLGRFGPLDALATIRPREAVRLNYAIIKRFRAIARAGCDFDPSLWL